MAEPSEPTEPTIWEIDANDVITSVGGGWGSFARGNGAPALADRAVVGRSLLDFVDGDEVRRLYRMFLRAVRSHGLSLSIPFRCDSPDLRRDMQLEMTGRSRGGVAFRSVLLRSEPRAPVHLLDQRRARRPELVVSCSFCHAIRLPEGGWLGLDRAVLRLPLLAAEQPPRLAHGVCTSCSARLRRGLERGDGGGDPDDAG